MSYEKQYFSDGEIITASQLNHIENGIVAASNVRNLLDNSDFRSGRVIAQAGENGYHGSNKYVCDRWISWDADAVFSDGYITPGSPIDQRIDPAFIDKTATYTAAICFADGTINVESGNFTNGFGSYTLGIYCPAVTTTSYVRLNTGNNIRWAALYEGEYTVDTLPAYQPKGYAAELAECQRYFCKTGETNWTASRPAVIGTTSYAPVSIRFPVPMRVNPTVTTYITTADIFGTGSVACSISNAAVNRTDYFAMLTFSADYSGKIVKPIGTIHFSADL